MFYTSYYAKMKSLPEGFIPVSISIRPPYWYKGLNFKYLAPSESILDDWHDNQDEKRYTERFTNEIISELRIIPLLKQLMKLLNVNTLDELLKLDVVFLCYEKGFCHRHLIAQWLTNNGLECKEWSDGSGPREKSVEEIRDEFLRHIWSLINYWDNLPDKTSKDKMEGLAFSTLVALDGESMDLPGFIVAPFPHTDDKSFHIEHGENYYPENNDNDVNGDIAGCLHEQFFRVKKEFGLENENRDMFSRHKIF